jgi:hypothetical protein
MASRSVDGRAGQCREGTEIVAVDLKSSAEDPPRPQALARKEASRT